MPARKRFGEWMLGVLFCALASSSHAANSLGFSVVSPELAGKRIAEAQVYKGFGCEGGNISPSLAWKNPPPGTRSYAVTIFDPDAPTGSGWWHWVMFNIPASVTSIPAGAGDPASGKAEDSVTLMGENLGKSSVSAVFLSDDKNDYKAGLMDQSADKIVMKVPKTKAGRYSLSIQVKDRILILPLKFEVTQ